MPSFWKRVHSHQVRNKDLGGHVLTQQHIQERLSLAYIHAVAGRAGVNISGARVHDYGVDGSLHPLVRRNGRVVETGFHLDFQAKSTTRWTHDGADVIVDLEAKTYNDLVTRDPNATPIVLIMMCLPGIDAEWLNIWEDSIVMRHCCYWLRLLPGPKTKNRTTIRVRIPRTNLLDVHSIHELLEAVVREARAGVS